MAISDSTSALPASSQYLYTLPLRKNRPSYWVVKAFLPIAKR